MRSDVDSICAHLFFSAVRHVGTKKLQIPSSLSELFLHARATYSRGGEAWVIIQADTQWYVCLFGWLFLVSCYHPSFCEHHGIIHSCIIVV